MQSVKGVIVCKENVACEPVWCVSPNVFLFLSEDSGNFTQIMLPPASEVKNYSLHSRVYVGQDLMVISEHFMLMDASKIAMIPVHKTKFRPAV